MLLFVPILGLRLQLTAVLLVLARAAVNCCACEAASDAVAGVTVTVIGG